MAWVIDDKSGADVALTPIEGRAHQDGKGGAIDDDAQTIHGVGDVVDPRTIKGNTVVEPVTSLAGEINPKGEARVFRIRVTQTTRRGEGVWSEFHHWFQLTRR